ncbi:MAG: Rieske 2Fe-2S domain-containing protein [Steroidobacteraceae bacterium]
MNTATLYRSRFLEHDPDRHVFRVHRSAYASPEVFEEEKRKVLYRSWVLLGHEAEIARPGDFVTRRVIDREIIFNRDSDGNVNVFYNSCMHRGPAVCKVKAGSAKTFICPYHGWAYRNNGQLASAGSRAADASYPPEYFKPGPGSVTLKRVKNVAQRAGFYFVNFDERAMPLDDFLAGAGARLDRMALQTTAGFELIAGVHEYDINANYKLLCENSYDGYHLLQTHATYLAYMAEMLKGSNLDPKLGGNVLTLGNGHACFEIPVLSGRPVAQWLPHWGEEAKRLIDEKRNEVIGRLGEERGANVCDFNSNMVIFPISIVNDQQTILARAIIPLSHNRMRVRAWSVAPKDEHPALRRIRMENVLSFLGPTGFATPDDVSMLEWAQTGYESTDVEWNDFSKGMRPGEPLQQGTTIYDDELHMRSYWLQWDKMMSAP